MNKFAHVAAVHYASQALQCALEALSDVSDEASVRHQADVEINSIREFVDFLYKPDDL